MDHGAYSSEYFDGVSIFIWIWAVRIVMGVALWQVPRIPIDVLVFFFFQRNAVWLAFRAVFTLCGGTQVWWWWNLVVVWWWFELWVDMLQLWVACKRCSWCVYLAACWYVAMILCLEIRFLSSEPFFELLFVALFNFENLLNERFHCLLFMVGFLHGLAKLIISQL